MDSAKPVAGLFTLKLSTHTKHALRGYRLVWVDRPDKGRARYTAYHGIYCSAEEADIDRLSLRSPGVTVQVVPASSETL